MANTDGFLADFISAKENVHRHAGSFFGHEDANPSSPAPSSFCQLSIFFSNSIIPASVQMMQELGRILDLQQEGIGAGARHAAAVSFTPVLLQQGSVHALGRPKTLKCLLASATGHQMHLPQSMHRLVSASTYGTDRCFMRIPLEALVVQGGNSETPPVLSNAVVDCAPLTVEGLWERGIKGVMRPLSSVKGISVADVPFFLLAEDIHCIVVDVGAEAPADVFEGCGGLEPSSSMQGNSSAGGGNVRKASEDLPATKKRRRKRSSQQHQSSVRRCFEDAGTGPIQGIDGRSYFPRRAAMFENMCGSALVYGYQLYDKSNASINSRLDECVCCARQAKKRLGSSSESVEVFSIHGNLVLRKDPSGTVVSFKVQHSLPSACNPCVALMFLMMTKRMRVVCVCVCASPMYPSTA
jgi:hypothetical protein